MVRRASRQTADAIDVELVETTSTSDDELEPPEPPRPGEGTDPDGTGRTPPRWSWRKRVVVGVVAAIVLATFGGVAAVQSARQEAARTEALAGSPGLVPPIDGPLEELWRIDGGGLNAEVAGLMIVTDGWTRSRTGTVLGVEPATGEVVWEFQPPDEGLGFTSCRALDPMDDQTGVPSGEVSDEPGDATTLLACMSIIDRGVRGLGDWEPSTTLDVLEATTGEQVLTVSEDGSLMMWDVVDGDVAMLLQLPDGRVAGTRVSVPGGERVWIYRTEEPLITADSVTAWGGSYGDGTFVVQGDPGLVLDLETGQELPGSGADGLPVTPSETVRTELPDGGTAEWTPTTRGDGSGRVLNADGTERFVLDGPVVSTVSDGSVPERIVIELPTPQLFAVLDSRDGHEVWRGETAQRPAARLDGLLVVVGVDVVSGVRIRDGVEQWSVTAANAHQVQILTDGSTLLVRRDAGSQRLLAAIDATEGSELWQMPLTDDVYFLQPTSSGPIVGYGADGIIAYG